MQAGILEAPTGTPDLTRAIMADQSISEEHKQALVRIYLSFRREHEDERGARGDDAHHQAHDHTAPAAESGPAPAAVPADAAEPGPPRPRPRPADPARGLRLSGRSSSRPRPVPWPEGFPTPGRL